MKSEVIILEDDKFYQVLMQKMIPEDKSFVIVKTSEELKAAITANPEAKLFILDDHVPASTGEKPNFHFIENAKVVIEENPGAKIIYIGSMPLPDVSKFCEKHKIIMIERYEIRGLFEEKKQE